ncbi:helix-turn-helix domain-containing protein [Specibacter cremeus]|uniref:helix-turn-helix domain-containing protein n=1 Tax=Specibacter cremeus TaxID=1629051 RepID=UPI000F76E5F7|nr:helix-turn-helix domain-containing protein [Specibacter cremeus]
MPRFLTLADVAEQLQISAAACYALVRSGELPAIQIGGRGQWRVEEAKFEEFIAGRYAAAADLLAGQRARHDA